ncbi:MAG: 2-oxo acid dehydrogenase subunit E2 [Anaerolineae bacterium]|nr:2-oxo acid dehydrogenase subunit E2 [Anaerolineae bacterium]
MAVEIVMPRLGWTMEQGTLVEWLKKDGDLVQPGDIMFIIESDKALNEVESFESGIFRIPPGSDVLGRLLPVGTLLAYIVQPGEAPPFEAASPVQTQVAAAPSTPPSLDSDQPSVTTTEPASNGRLRLPAISPRARRVAAELSVDWSSLTGSGRSGRIVERDVRAAAMTPVASPMLISPVARRAAEELGVDVAALAAQMPGQRITREHVERAAHPTAPVPASPDPTENRVPMSRLRQVIADRMVASAQTTASVTLTTEVDSTELVRVRQSLKDASLNDPRPVPSYTDLLAKLTAEALTEHPGLNARLQGDALVSSPAVHVGFAVDTERGLIVPVVRDVHRKSIRQIAAESAALVEQARNGTIRPDDLSGGTFTLTNLGMYDIDAFTPIINLPQCAILGIGRIVPKQVVIDAAAERLAIRQMMFLSLTFDHRLVDGAPAARFLQRVKQFVEQPYLWLIN